MNDQAPKSGRSEAVRDGLLIFDEWAEIEERAYQRARRELNEARAKDGDTTSYTPFSTRGD